MIRGRRLPKQGHWPVPVASLPVRKAPSGQLRTASRTLSSSPSGTWESAIRHLPSTASVAKTSGQMSSQRAWPWQRSRFTKTRIGRHPGYMSGAVGSNQRSFCPRPGTALNRPSGTQRDMKRYRPIDCADPALAFCGLAGTVVWNAIVKRSGSCCKPARSQTQGYDAQGEARSARQ